MVARAADQVALRKDAANATTVEHGNAPIRFSASSDTASRPGCLKPQSPLHSPWLKESSRWSSAPPSLSPYACMCALKLSLSTAKGKRMPTHDPTPPLGPLKRQFLKLMVWGAILVRDRGDRSAAGGTRRSDHPHSYADRDRPRRRPRRPARHRPDDAGIPQQPRRPRLRCRITSRKTPMPSIIRTPVLRVVPGPSDINANGHIFGGWVLSQMDIAAGIVASRRAGDRSRPSRSTRWSSSSRSTCAT